MILHHIGQNFCRTYVKFLLPHLAYQGLLTLGLTDISPGRHDESSIEI